MPVSEVRLKRFLGTYIRSLEQRLHAAFAQRYRKSEYEIRDQLSGAHTLREIMQISRSALESLGIGGVNVYRYSNESTNLWSTEREALQGTSRYSTPGPVLPGEKRFFINTGKERGFPGNHTDILLFDRLNDIAKMSKEEDRAQAEADFESDLKKYFGENYQEKYAGRIEDLKLALRYNLYIRYPGFGHYDMVIMANLHVKNADLVKRGEKPLVLLGNEVQRKIVFETLGNLQKPITDELIKSELMRQDRIQLIRRKITHDLMMAMDRVADPKELFEMLLENLPLQFMRGPEETYVERSSVMLFNEDEGGMRITSARGLTEEIIRDTFVKPGVGRAGQVFATGKALLVLDATNSDVFQDRGDPAKVAPGSFMLVPIKYKTESGCKILGVLNIRSRHPRAFRDEDLQHLETLAGILANKLRLAKLINMDGLTEVLYQRKPGVEKLDAMLAVAHQKKIPLAFLMLDLDYFKHINDTYEHSGGDAALRGTAEVIHRFILSHKEELKDHVEIRWGGDELAVVLFGVDRRRAQELAEELREKISQKIYTIYGEEFSLTTSIGIAIWPMHGSSSEALSKNADKAAYRSKRDGRNRVIIFNPEDREMRETIVPK